ncbi:5'-methylthioadenosine/adenosylhomocysteine nucleosidase [Orbaceae bacterium ac157xtp]
MKVAIIAAMEEEVAILRSKITDCEVENCLGVEFYSGKIQNCDVVLVQSGIGKVAASMSISLLLSRFEIDAVINTGSAAGLDRTLNVGDVVVSSHALYHDVDLTSFGYEPGQMAGCPIAFNSDETLINIAKSAIESQNVNAVEGLIISGDQFINGDKVIKALKQKFPDAIAVEMEATAIAHVCWRLGVPFIVVRAISDNGDDESAVSFDTFLPIAAKQSSLIVEQMLKQLSK